MYCKKCGTEINSEVKVCPQCGQDIKNSNEENIKQNDKKQNNLYAKAKKKNIFKDKIGIFPMYQAIIYGLSVCTFISCLLPFVSVSIFGFKQSVTYISGDGIIVTILVILSCIAIKFKKFILSIIPSVLALSMVAYDLINISSRSNGMATWEVGAYLCLLSSIILSIASIYIFIENKKMNIQ